MKAKTVLVLVNGLRQHCSECGHFEAFGPNGELLLEYSIFDAIEAGFNKVVFVIQAHFVKEFKKIMKPKLDRKLHVEFISQNASRFQNFLNRRRKNRKPWEVVHAPWAARKVIKEPFLVIDMHNYYGKQAYKSAFKFLEQNVPDFAVLGFPLGQTLSNYGRVDRGICIWKESTGELDSIIGIKGVRKDYTNRIEFRSPKGFLSNLTSEDTVSTNMFCLTPTFFDFAEDLLSNFGTNGKNDESMELMIPDVINHGISKGRVKGQILEANSTWFGATYKADRIMAKYKIEDKIKRGLYPHELFT